MAVDQTLETTDRLHDAVPRTRRRVHPETRIAIVMVAPALIVVASVYLYPAIVTLVFSLAMVDVATFSVDRFVWLDHYLAVVRDPTIRAVAVRTLYYGSMVALLTTISAFPIALLLNRRFWGRGVVRVVVLLPWAVPPIVSGVMWGQIFHAEFGFLNGLIRAFGGAGRVIWLGDATLALHAIMAAEIWRALPLATLFLLAGLQTLPQSVYEAAAIDGAGPWRRFRHMTLPLMLPVVLPVLIFQFVWAMKTFDTIFVLTRGGPGTGTTTLNYLVYRESFEYLNFGQSAAIAYTLSLVTLLVIVVLGYVRWRAVVRSGEGSR